MYYISTEAHEGYTNLMDKGEAKGNRSGMEKRIILRGNENSFPLPHPKQKFSTCCTMKKHFLKVESLKKKLWVITEQKEIILSKIQALHGLMKSGASKEEE